MVKDTADNSAGRSGPAKTEAGPDIAPQGRGEAMQAHSQRRKGEPAAAPLETDAESGGASALAGMTAGQAPDDPAKPLLNEKRRSDAATARHQVRAGPGDAGAQDAPEVLPKTPHTPKASLGRIVLWFVVPFVIVLALYWAMTV